MKTLLQLPKDYIAVDGGCANTGGGGVGYYRGILIENGETKNGKVIFEKEFPQTSNNLTEYLAILDAMKWRIDHDCTKIPIYSDSSVALSWIRKGSHNCDKLPMWKHAKEYTDKMEKWRNKVNAPFENIYQRFTKKRGDIPADYGRKPGGVNLYPKKQARDIQILKNKIEKGKANQEFSLESISRTMYADFYGEATLREIEQMTDEHKPNMTQLHFGALIASGIPSEIAYQSVFIDVGEQMIAKKKEFMRASGFKKMDIQIDMEKLERNICTLGNMYAHTPGVVRATTRLSENEVDTVCGIVNLTPKGLTRYLYNLMQKLQLEVMGGRNIAFNANSMRNVIHEIAVINNMIVPDNINIFSFGKDILQETNNMGKEELVNVISEAL